MLPHLFTCTPTDHFDSFIQGPLISILNSHDFTCGSVLAVFDLGCVKLEKKKNYCIYLLFLTRKAFRDWERKPLLMLC